MVAAPLGVIGVIKVLGKFGDYAAQKQMSHRALRRQSFLGPIWKNGIIRSTVGVGATTVLVATMMFGGGGFNPATASSIDSQDTAVEQQLLDAVENSEPILEPDAAEGKTGSQDQKDPEAPVGNAESSVPEEPPVLEKPAETHEVTTPESEEPSSDKAVETMKLTDPTTEPSAKTEAPKKAEAKKTTDPTYTPDSEPKSTPAKDAPATAGVAGAAGICDTNPNTGKVSSFMQRSDITEFHNGNEKIGLYEGGYVHQRVQLIDLTSGENEFVFTYKVREGGLWAYDYVDQYSMTSGTITNIKLIEGSGIERVDTVKLTFDAISSSDELFFSAHIASELDHGPGTGASSINGSPYHVTLVSLNCAETGSKDNQIMAGDVQAGFVTIIKDAIPADGTDFGFTLKAEKTQDSVYFKLDDSAVSDIGSTELPDRVTYTVAPGGVNISENTLPAGWNLKDLTCTGVTPTIDMNVRTATFNLVDNAKVACVFTNAKTTYKDLEVTKTAVATFDRDYGWTIEKSLAAGQPSTIKSATGDVAVNYSVLVEATDAKDSNFVVDGVITVTNPNNVAIGGVTLTDSVPDAQCSIEAAAGAVLTGPVSVPSGTTNFNYACDMPSGTTADSDGTNTVTATWDASSYYGTDGEASASRDFTFVGVEPTVTDDSVTVTDDQLDLSIFDGGNVVTVDHAPKTFDYSITWPGVAGECKNYENTATYTEKDGGTGSDSASVDVCRGADLLVTKNVMGSFNRSYPWEIDKIAVNGDGPYATDAEGNVVVDYRVTVAPGTPTDSDWAMSGVMTVQNPNTWQDITATLSDFVDVGGGAVCTVTGTTGADPVIDADPMTEGFQTVIRSGPAQSFAYSCTFTSLPSYMGTNTATATWDAASAFTPRGVAEGTAEVSMGTWNETPLNKTVVITDDHHNFDTDWTITWEAGMQPQVETYSITWTVPADAEGKCDNFTNIAKLVGDSGLTDTATETIRACFPPDLDVDKSSDPETGSYVAPGSLVNYTLTFTNSGGLPAEVNYVDHLADVFDDAGFNDGSLVAGAGLAAGLDGDKILITGSVESGTTATVTYSVTVKTTEFGNGVAINFLVPDGETPPEECDPEVDDCTEHPILGAVSWEKVDALGNALAGSEWELTGPDETVPQAVEDCSAANTADCSGVDRDPAAGAFALTDLEWGTYALVETRAPAGFVLDPTVRSFTIGGEAPAQLIVDLDSIENEQQPGLALPLTGGMGSQTFLFAGGTALLASLALVGWRLRKEGGLGHTMNVNK